MKKYLFLLALFSFFIVSCGKTMVNPAHINKFTCKVNGVFWESVPLQRDILGNDLRIDILPFSDIIGIFANNAKKNQTISLDFSLNDTMKTSVIRNSYPYGDYSRHCVGYNLDTLSKRIVTVTEHDKIKRIVKGTFSFRAIDRVDSCKDTVTITDGFFDMKYLVQ